MEEVDGFALGECADLACGVARSFVFVRAELCKCILEVFFVRVCLNIVDGISELVEECL